MVGDRGSVTTEHLGL